MALSIIDRLLGRPEPMKAVTGPGAFAMTYHTPLHSFSRDPHKLMAEAQGLFHSNGWVGAVERALGGRFVRMAWHLENENGDTIDEKSPAPYQVPLRLLERSTGKTRAKLWGVTFRHVGLAGNGFWYLDQRDGLAGTPLDLVYINPARMTPAIDAGGNVIGWVLDHPDNLVVNQRSTNHSRTGVPMTTEEVIHFTMDEPDWGIWGIGIAESAQRKIALDDVAGVHLGGVLGSGGRLTGLVTPKAANSVSEDQWIQFVRDWRSIASDPDAAKRLQIAQMPLDFTQMSASPKDLQLSDINKQNRDDIFALWGLPLSQRGIDTSAGLNADRSTGDEATAWETVKERSEPIRESIQYELLDRWQALGVKVTLVFDYPPFDDDSPKYVSAEKSVKVAMTNDERRNILGLEPLEDEDLGGAIYIDSRLTRIDVEPEEPEEPEPETPAPPVVLPDVAMEEEAEVVKASLTDTLLTLRAKVEKAWEPKMRAAIAQVLTEQRRFAISKAEHIARKPKETSWWNDTRERRRFMVALEPLIADMAAEVAGETRRKVGSPKKADAFLDDVLEAIRTSVGSRITGINRTTREKVQAAVLAGVEAGENPAALGVRIRDSAAFDEYRSELISRTETAQVYNDAALHSYNALEVTEVEAIDGDVDAECAARNGKRYPIDEAMGISDHPNGTLDWIPVVKATLPPDPMLIMAEAFKASMDRPPVINVTTPDVNVTTPPVNIYPEFHPAAVTVNVPEQPAPVVNVTTPDVTVNVPEAKASLPADVHVVSMPDRMKVAQRDGEGYIERMVETDLTDG